MNAPLVRVVQVDSSISHQTVTLDLDQTLRGLVLDAKGQAQPDVWVGATCSPLPHAAAEEPAWRGPIKMLRARGSEISLRDRAGGVPILAGIAPPSGTTNAVVLAEGAISCMERESATNARGRSLRDDDRDVSSWAPAAAQSPHARSFPACRS